MKATTTRRLERLERRARVDDDAASIPFMVWYVDDEGNRVVCEPNDDDRAAADRYKPNRVIQLTWGDD